MTEHCFIEFVYNFMSQYVLINGYTAIDRNAIDSWIPCGSQMPNPTFCILLDFLHHPILWYFNVFNGLSESTKQEHPEKSIDSLKFKYRRIFVPSGLKQSNYLPEMENTEKEKKTCIINEKLLEIVIAMRYIVRPIT